MDYSLFKSTLGVLVTVGLYSILYRETKLYRFFEHLFIGLSVGWALVAFWTEALKELWWDKMVGMGSLSHGGSVPGMWPYAILVPLGLMGYTVFSRRHHWMSRIPIGIMLGFGAGQQILVWWTAYGPQIKDSMRVIFPTQLIPLFTPKNADPLRVYASEALSNLVFVFTIFVVLSYFLYSFNPEKKVMTFSAKWGRWLMMVGFGAIFGSTVMARFSLMIDRMYFIWVEWLLEGVLKR